MRRTYPITKIVNVYDGDTITLVIDLGFDLEYRAKVRLFGINTPEMRGGTAESKAAAQRAKDAAKTWLNQRKGRVRFVSHEDERGKYGRALGDVVDDDGETLTEYLLANGHAVRYLIDR